MSCLAFLSSQLVPYERNDVQLQHVLFCHVHKLFFNVLNFFVILTVFFLVSLQYLYACQSNEFDLKGSHGSRPVFLYSVWVCFCFMSGSRCLCFMHQRAWGVIFQQQDEDIKAGSGTAVNIKRLDSLSSVTSPTLPIKFHQRARHASAAEWKEIPHVQFTYCKTAFPVFLAPLPNSNLKVES